MVPKSKNAKTGLFQLFRSHAIFYYKFLMLTTIYFYDYLFFKINKIENVIFIRVLSPEFQAFHLPAAQNAP